MIKIVNSTYLLFKEAQYLHYYIYLVFFVAERKKLELADKYKDLQKTGNIDKYLSRKRKKNAAKEKKRLPKNLLKGNV